MSNSKLQPIKLWGQGGPNPPKVAMVLKELDLPHEIIPIEFAELKQPAYLAINPNGRMPAIYDPNTSLTLWESGAIVEYLIEKYDTEHKISFPAGSNEAYHAKQWLYFQVSGQGPYYGQVPWFKKFHPERLPSAIERYVKEIARVTGVLETHLAKQKVVDGEPGPWLVGGKMSYADVAFFMWQHGAPMFATKEEGFDPEQYPTVTKWLNNMQARPALKEVLEASARAN